MDKRLYFCLLAVPVIVFLFYFILTLISSTPPRLPSPICAAVQSRFIFKQQSNFTSQYSPTQLAQINAHRPDSPPPYLDPKFLGSCKVHLNRAGVYGLLRWWIQFAGDHKIVWWLHYGTLIGSVR